MSLVTMDGECSNIQDSGCFFFLGEKAGCRKDGYAYKRDERDWLEDTDASHEAKPDDGYRNGCKDECTDDPLFALFV